MVRAEVVFLGGGEVEDEVEEAAHSHELAEGRLENTGRAEMLTAINFMSRAEAQLNDGRAAEALVFERQALASLERALDRRRYFLRTLPDRSRIDITRRLDRRAHAKRDRGLRDQLPASPAPRWSAHRQVMRELDGGRAPVPVSTPRSPLASPRSIPSSPSCRRPRSRLHRLRQTDAPRRGARTAMRAVTAHALRTLPPSTAIELRTDPLAGALADELRGGHDDERHCSRRIAVGCGRDCHRRC